MSFLPALGSIGSIASGISSLFGGSSSSSGLSSLMGNVNNSQQNLEQTEMQDQISQMDQEASVDQMKTKSQMAASLTDAENQMSAAWQQVTTSKDQAEEAILKTDTQATAQA